MSAWMVEALIASSILMLLVLMIRKPVAAQFGPRMAYWLWLLPALRMVMPPLPASWTLRPTEKVQAIALDYAPDLVVATNDAVEASLSWAAIIVGIWAVGVAGHFALHLWAYNRFARRAVADATLLREIDPGAIQLLATTEVNGPLAMGIARPTILVPADFEWRYDAQERECAIAHEVAHHRRGDLKVNLGALAMLSLHWFNPLAHMAYRAFRTDQELACDATIVAAADQEGRHAYGRALVKSACDRAPMIACSLNRKQELKRRLRMMRFGKLSAAQGALASTLGFGLISGGLLVTASVGAQAAAETKVGRLVQTGVEESGAAVSQALSAVVEQDARRADAEAKWAEDEAKIAEDEAKSAEQLAWKSQEEAAAITKSGSTPEATQAAEEARATAEEARAAAEEARQTAIEVRRVAIEAQREAMDDAREAEREAMEAAREAEQDVNEAIRELDRELQQAIRENDKEVQREVRAALAEMRRQMKDARKDLSRMRFLQSDPTPPAPPAPPSPVQGATPPAPPARSTALAPLVPPTPTAAGACTGKPGTEQINVITKVNGQTKVVTTRIACEGRAGRVSKAELDRVALVSLQRARVQIVSMPNLSEAQRAQAMAKIDASITSLKNRIN